MFNIVNMNSKNIPVPEFDVKYMPVKDYAEMKRISVQAVYQMIRRENLEIKKIGTYTLVKVKV